METGPRSNKETTKTCGTLKSYFKTSKNVRSAIPIPVDKQRNSSTSAKKKKVKPVPDFSKLHRNWNTKLESGKALSKKPCTVSTEFDLTKPGSQFTRVPKRELGFQEEENEEPVHSDLTSICEVVSESYPENEQIIKTPSKGVKRRVLGEITSTEINSPNKSPRTNSKQKHFSQERLSPNQGFECDDKALNSILTNKGVSVSNMYTPGRLTQLQSQSTKPSMSSQRAPRFSTRELLQGGMLEAVPIRNSIYVSYKLRNIAQQETPATPENNTAPRDILSARRVLKSQFSAHKFQSPALRVYSPMSILKKPNTDLPAQSRHKKPNWADVLSSPLNVRPVPLARNLDYEDENKVKDFEIKSISPVRTITANLENETSEVHVEAQMVQLMPLLNAQPEVLKSQESKPQDIQRLQGGQQINTHTLVSEVGENILQNPTNPENMVTEALFPDVQKFISKSLKHRRQSADKLHESLSESQSFLGKLNNCKTILGELNHVEELKAQLALAEKSLRDQLKITKDDETENIPPVLTSLPFAENAVIKNLFKTEHERLFCSKIPQEPKINVCEDSNSPAPLDLSVKSNLIQKTIRNVVEQTPDKHPDTKTWETPGTLQLTPFITKKVQGLQLTETTSISCDSKEPAQSCTLNIANTETKTLDIEGSNSTSKSPCSLTPLAENGYKSFFNNRDNHMKILSPIAEKLTSQTTCHVLGENLDFLRPPIWTPLALKSLGAINSPRPGDLEPEVLSHGASMVVDASRCQSNDDSHSLLSSTSPLPSASCINQSADSEDGKIGRHLALCGSPMTQTPCISSPDNSAAILPYQTYQKFSSPTLHKSGQVTVPRHNLTHLAKDGHSASSRTQDIFIDSTPTVFPMPTVLSAIVPIQTDSQQNCLTENIFSAESAKTDCQPRTFQGHLKKFQGQANFQSRTAQRPQSESPKPASTTDDLVTNQRRLSGNGKDNVRVDSRRHLTPPHGEVGSLSLRANVFQRHRPAARISPNVHSERRFANRLQDSQQMFLETLLDEECALFTCCRPLSLNSYSTNRCPNPVAQVLSQGDAMHFLPISDDYHGEHGHLEGSAFGSYTPVHTRSASRPN